MSKHQKDGLNVGFVHVKCVPWTSYSVSLNVYFPICKTQILPTKIVRDLVLIRHIGPDVISKYIVVVITIYTKCYNFP